MLWAFDAPAKGSPNAKWKAKFPQNISTESKDKLEKLIAALNEHDDIQNIFTNVAWLF